MTILSFSFILFVIALLIVYYVVPKRCRWIVLLVGSVFFYASSSKWLIMYPIFTTIVIYFVGLAIEKKNKALEELKTADLNDDEKSELKTRFKKDKKRYVLVGVALSILCIIVTKYACFLLSNLNYVLGLFEVKFETSFKFLVPLGISYYTLEAISYIVDVYRGKCQASKNIFIVLLYLLYFPKIVEGPINRFKDFMKEVESESLLDFENVMIGLDLVLYGLFKKMVIADRAGIFANQVFGSDMGGVTVLLAMILYTVQIYAEFGGCIDIVRGVSRMFGIALPVNFKRPFFSKSVQEFWQRWHISLGTWIKEYVFFPISLSKMNAHVCKTTRAKLKPFWAKFIAVAFPLFFVWIVNGIWHGASYKYVAYGMYYYLVMMVGLLFKPLTDSILNKIKISDGILNVLRMIRTCILVVIGMTLFRATSLGEFVSMMGNLFKSSAGILDHGLVAIDFVLLIMGNVVVFVIGLLEEKNIISLENGFTKNPVLRSIIYTVAICIIVMFGIYGDGYDASEFIYGAF